MNPELDCIFSRRSVQKYQDRRIPEAIFRDLLEAAMAAPSAVARDPWHFLVIKKPDTLQQLADILPNGAVRKSRSVRSRKKVIRYRIIQDR